MHSTLHSSAASLKNYSKSIIKILRRFLLSYLPSDLASLFEFSWFLCPLVLTVGIVPGRGCHDFQRHPFSAPQEGIFVRGMLGERFYFRQKMSTQHQLNASGLEQRHVTRWWRFCEGAKTKREKLGKRCLWEFFLFFPLVFSLLRKWRTPLTFWFSSVILVSVRFDHFESHRLF